MSTISRSRLLGSGSALALATPAFLAAAEAAPKGDAATDVATLNAALPLARAAVKTYGDAASTNVLGPTVVEVIKQFQADHQAHVDSIAAAIAQAGGTATADAGTAADVASAKTEADLLGALYALERTTAAAYLAALAELKNKDVTRSTGAMLGVVTTHVALLAEALRRGQPYPTGFVTA